MKLNSLALRLFATAALWTAVVLPLAGLLIYSIYQREARSDFDSRLKTFLYIILADSTARGGETLEAPQNVGEALFEIVDSGWYWQIQPVGGTGQLLKSGSLATGRIALADDTVPSSDEGLRWWDGQGPDGKPIRIVELRFQVDGGPDAPEYSFLVAGPLNWVYAREGSFRTLLAAALAFAGIGLIGMTFLQIRFGLLPLRRIEKGLAAIRSGDAERLQGNLPAEIEPLQIELNALIKSNQDIIERARTQVGNLAHALKTPLAVIANEAEASRTPLAGKVVEQSNIMRQQITHYLDRARVAARVGTIGGLTSVEAVAVPLKRVLERIYEDRNVEIELQLAEGLKFQGEQQDLEEMLGNLLDNACKWSHGYVCVTGVVKPMEDGQTTKRLLLAIEDDGQGLNDDQMAQIVTRGTRLDETVPGSGLGLSIVKDLAGLYSGSFRLSKAAMGGLRAELDLPAA